MQIQVSWQIANSGYKQRVGAKRHEKAITIYRALVNSRFEEG